MMMESNKDTTKIQLRFKDGFTWQYPSTHTTLFWSPHDVVLTLWTLYGRQNDVVCLLGLYGDALQRSNGLQINILSFLNNVCLWFKI